MTPKKVKPHQKIAVKKVAKKRASSPKRVEIRNDEQTYRVEMCVGTFGNPRQVLQVARNVLRVLKLAGIEVAMYRIVINGEETLRDINALNIDRED